MSAVVTPTVRQGLKKKAFWLGFGAIIVLASVIVLMTRGSAVDSTPFSAGNAAPAGSLALAEVLAARGVAVTATNSLAATRKSIAAADRTTVLMSDPGNILSERQLVALLGMTHRIVVLAPSATALRILAPGVRSAGAPAPTTVSAARNPAACPEPAVIRSGTVTAAGSTFRVSGAGADTSLCLQSSGGGGTSPVYSLVSTTVGTTRVTVVGATGAFSNELIADHGNAALALNLLGSDPALVWYLPSSLDRPSATSMAELTPGWVTPVGVLIALTVAAAGVWRGRRFGPLIVENLPVMVRASETMEGRARLYQQGSARLRALDSLRIGTVNRLSVLLGLAGSASLDEVVRAAAAALAIDDRRTRALLVDAVPRSDRELVTLSDQLLTLETDVARAIRP